jgi:hypothetical protein
MTKVIRNGLYSISTKLLDGLGGGQTGISVLRDGKMLGGDSVLYHVGSYQCSDGKWKGEVTSREHSPTVRVRPFAGHISTPGICRDLYGRGRGIRGDGARRQAKPSLENSISAADSGLIAGRSRR